MKNSAAKSEISAKIRGVVLGAVMGSLIIVALISLSAIVFVKSGILPGDYIIYILLLIDLIGSFIGGFMAGSLIKSRGMMWGAFTGFILFLIVFASGMAVNDSTITLATLYKLIVLVLSGLIGGIKGVNKKEKIRIK